MEESGMAASRMRLTKRVIDDLDAAKGRRYVYDTISSSLAVLVTESGTKSFYVVKKHRGVQLRQYLGTVSALPLEYARNLAAQKVASFLAGSTPEELSARFSSIPAPAPLALPSSDLIVSYQVLPGGSTAPTGTLPLLPCVPAPDLPEEQTLTLRQLLDEYLEYAEEHRRECTVRGYRYMMERHLKPWAGERTLISLRRREVTAFHKTMGRAHGHFQANRMIAILRASINRAIREHELNLHNPAIAITFYRELRRSRRLFIEELPAFFQALEDEPNRSLRDFLLVALFTGARKSNLMHMRWEHLSIERGIWIIPAEESKSNTELPVVLVERVRQILRVRRAQATSPWVFPGRYPYKPMTNPNVGWIRILERSGLKGLRMHDLRRSLASFQIDTGTPLEVIQKTLGHESKTTTEIYARLAMEPVRLSLERATEEMLRSRQTAL